MISNVDKIEYQQILKDKKCDVCNVFVKSHMSNHLNSKNHITNQNKLQKKEHEEIEREEKEHEEIEQEEIEQEEIEIQYKKIQCNIDYDDIFDENYNLNNFKIDDIQYEINIKNKHCNVCDIKFCSKNKCKSHFNTQKHKIQMEKINSTSKYVGICYDKFTDKWQAKIKGQYLGRYNTEEETVLVRNNKALELNNTQNCAFKIQKYGMFK